MESAVEKSETKLQKELQKETASRDGPKLFLTLDRVSCKPTLTPHAALSVCMNAAKIQAHLGNTAKESQLYFTDVQSLLLAVAFPQAHHHWPRWCRVIRPSKVERVLVVLCDRVTKRDIDLWRKETKQRFVPQELEVKIEVPSPHCYGCSPENELLSVPLQYLTAAARERSMKHLSVINGCRFVGNKNGSDDESPEQASTSNSPSVKDSSKDSSCVVTTIVEKDQKKWNVCHCARDRYPRSLLLLGSSQLSRENYPMPGIEGTHDFLATKDAYEDVSDTSPMLSLDCEMVLTGGERPMELARVTLVNENLEIVYDTLVKPDRPVVNYLTAKSGITKRMLDPVTKRLKDVQMDLMDLLPASVILIGQSLNCDLQALKMFHPYCIDTSVIFNLSGVRRQKAGLKVLASRFLNQTIQVDKGGHSSAEDAMAAIRLVQLKLSKSLEFGDVASGQWSSAEMHSDVEDGDHPSVKRRRIGDSDDDLEVNRPAVKTSRLSPTRTSEESSDESGDSSADRSDVKLDDPEVRAALHRHKKFLSVHGTAPWCRPFMTLLAEAGNSIALLDREEHDVFPEEAINSLTNVLLSRKDKRRVTALPIVLDEHKWTFMRLHQAVNSEEKRSCRVSKLHKHITRAFEALTPRSLMIVILNGHPDRPEEMAQCFSGLKK